MKKTILLFILGISFSLNAQTSDEIIKDFFVKYQENSDSAIDYLFGSNKYMSGQTDAVYNIKFKLRENQALLGKFIGYEKLSESNLGQSQKRIVISANYERQPIRFILIFYKPEDKWIAHNFYFDDDFTEEFQKK